MGCGRGAGDIEILRDDDGSLAGISLGYGYHAEQDPSYRDINRVDEPKENDGRTENEIKEKGDYYLTKTKDGKTMMFYYDGFREITEDGIESIADDIYSENYADRNLIESNKDISNMKLASELEEEARILGDNDLTEEQKRLKLADRKSIYATWTAEGIFAMISRNEQGEKNIKQIYDELQKDNLVISTSPDLNWGLYSQSRAISFTRKDILKELQKEYDDPFLKVVEKNTKSIVDRASQFFGEKIKEFKERKQEKSKEEKSNEDIEIK